MIFFFFLYIRKYFLPVCHLLALYIEPLTLQAFIILPEKNLPTFSLLVSRFCACAKPGLFNLNIV